MGGDEFAVILPGGARRGRGVDEGDRRSRRHQQRVLSRPAAQPVDGLATSEPGERLEAVVKRADLAMLETKRAFYARAEGGEGEEARAAAS